jgi:hypothetical protein
MPHYAIIHKSDTLFSLLMPPLYFAVWAIITLATEYATRRHEGLLHAVIEPLLN